MCFPLPYRVPPVFVHVVSPPLGWSPVVSFLPAVWSPSGDTRGPSVVFEAVDVSCPGPLHFSHIADVYELNCPLPDPHVCASILVRGVEHTSFHFVLCKFALYNACLVSVHVHVCLTMLPNLYFFHSCRSSRMYFLIIVYMY